ncbi:hypothetical protein ACHWQZ_G018723 [Mnemiopsis leidyi]
MLKKVPNSLFVLLLLIALPHSLERLYTEAWQDNTLTITCKNTAYVIIIFARYYAPGAPCPAAHYLDQVQGCRQCSEGTYNSGGTTSSCYNCPTGKTVAAGSGTSQSDCYWIPCPAAHYLDQVQGCRQCSEGTYSSGGTASSCSNCPTGKTVEAGSGTSESDCTWIPCPAAHYLDQVQGCRQCSEGTYSSGGTTSSCYKCSAGTYRDSTVTICTKCAENSITEQSGAASCTSCPAGTVSNEERTQCVKCSAGTYRDTTHTICTKCAENSITEKSGAASCTSCPAETVSNEERTQCGAFLDSECPELTVDNALVSQSVDGQVTQNTVATVTCLKPKHYVMFGNKEVTCQSDGWNDKPECRKCGSYRGQSLDLPNKKIRTNEVLLFGGNTLFK